MEGPLHRNRRMWHCGTIRASRVTSSLATHLKGNLSTRGPAQPAAPGSSLNNPAQPAAPGASTHSGGVNRVVERCPRRGRLSGAPCGCPRRGRLSRVV
eukprot:1179437-Prorocentrum_minimum.AAC.1